MLLILLLCLFLYDGLVHCVEFKKADFKALMRAHGQNSSTWNNTPPVYQQNPITPEFAFFTPSTSLLEEIKETRRNQNARKKQRQRTNMYVKNMFFRQKPFTIIDSSGKRDEYKDQRSSYSSPEDSKETTDDTEDYEHKSKTVDFKTKEESTSIELETSGRISETDDMEPSHNDLRHISESYIESKDTESSVFRTHSESLESLPQLRTRKMEYAGRLVPNLLLGKTMILYEELNNPTTPKPNQKWNFGYNQPVNKKPRNKEENNIFVNDKEIFKKMAQKKENGKVLRMHTISTKKKWYSDGIKVENGVRTYPAKDWLRTTAKRMLKPSYLVDTDWSFYGIKNQKPDSKVSTTHRTSTTYKITTTHSYESSIKYLRMQLSISYLYKMMEVHHEGYMMVFLVELMRILASKTPAEIHDVVKHADQIIFRQRKRLQWMGHPLLDKVQKIAKMLKVTEISLITDLIAEVYQMLVHRRERLPLMMNTIMEYAETLYDDEEGRQLFEALLELVEYPNIAVTGYTLCNNLINAFLRPYRRLKDTQQLQELVGSINLALSTRDPLRIQQQQLGAGRGLFGKLNSLGVAHTSPNKENLLRQPVNIHRQLRKRKKKKKHHHRHNKRKSHGFFF